MPPMCACLYACDLGRTISQQFAMALNKEHRIVIVVIVYVYNGNNVSVPTGPFVLSSDAICGYWLLLTRAKFW